jgi:small subunit ribosomal protein S18
VLPSPPSRSDRAQDTGIEHATHLSSPVGRAQGCVQVCKDLLSEGRYAFCRLSTPTSGPDNALVQVRLEVDYRKIDMLRAFTGKQGMLLGRRTKFIRAVTQRKVARAVKNARQMALMPHVGLHPVFEDAETTNLREAFEELDAVALSQGM